MMRVGRSDIGILCCAVAVALSPFDVAIPESGFGPWFIRPLMIVVALLASIALIVNRKRIDVPLAAAVGLFLSAIAAASSLSDDPDLGYAATVRVTVAALVLVAMSASIHNRGHGRVFLIASASMVVLASVIGIAVLVNGGEIGPTDTLLGRISVTNGVARLTRPFSQANVAAMSLAPLGVLLLTAGSGDERELSRLRPWLSVGGLIGAIALLLTLSRGGMVALILSLCAYLAIVLVRREMATLLLPGAVAVVLASAPLWLSRWGARVDDSTTGALRAPGRADIWQQAIDAWLESPLFGVGPGQFGRFSVDAAPSGVAPSPHAHNLVLEVMATAGAVGVVTLVVLVVVIAMRLLNIGDDASPPLPFVLAVAAVVLHSLVDYPLVFTSSGVVAAAVVGGAVGVARGLDVT